MSSNNKRGVSWTLLSTLLGVILQTAQLAVTVRYLSTSDIGVIAIVNVLIAIANMLKDFGLSSFLIHRQTISHREQSTLFWLTLSIGVGIAIVVCGISSIAATFYEMPALENLLYISAVNIAIIASCSQWQALMLKTFRFVELARMEIIVKFIGFVSTILFLELGLGYYSPILAVLTANLTSFTMLYLLNRKLFTPGLLWERSIANEAFKYGMYQVGGQFLNQLRANLDTLLIGKYLGAGTVGIYSLAKELILRPARLIQPVVNRFALPNFASSQGDREAQSKLYLKTATILVCINGAVYSAILLLAEPITFVLYGKDLSLETTPYIQILAMFGFVRCLGVPMGSIAQANGRTDIEFRWNLISTFLFSIIIAVAVNHGLLATTIAMSLGQLFMTHLSYFIFLKPICAVKFSSFLRLSIPIPICMFIQSASYSMLTTSWFEKSIFVVVSLLIYTTISWKHYKSALVMIKPSA